jgi:hypothetical protein
MSRLLIVLQSSAYDQEHALDLARLIADMEDVKTAEADFMFANSFNSWPRRDVVTHVAHKFVQVHKFNSMRTDTGWPAGPNCVFFSTLDRIYMGVKREGWDYDAVLFLEPDCCPLRKGWWREIYAEFKTKGKMVGGFMYTAKDHPTAHINGAAIFSPAIRGKHKEFFWSDNRVGWDCFHAPMLLSESYASPLFWVDYKRATIDADTLFANKKWPKHHPCHKAKVQPCFYHGVKDGSARQHVRNKLGLNNA